MLEQNVVAPAAPNGGTALGRAADWGRLDMVQLLLNVAVAVIISAELQ